MERINFVKKVTGVILILGILVVGMDFLSVNPAVSKENVTIKFAAWWFIEPGRIEWLKAHCKKFERENPNIKVEPVPVTSNEVHDKMMVEFAAGKGPDITCFRDMSLKTWIRQDFLEPLNKYIDFSKYDLESINDIAMVNGNRYAVVLYAFPYGDLIYNSKMFEEAGVKPPVNLKEFMAVTKKLTKAPAQYGFGIAVNPSNTVYFYQSIVKIVYGFGGRTVRKGVPCVNEPAYIRGIEFFKKIYDSKVMPWGTAWRTQRTMMGHGKIAMIMDGPYMFDVFKGIDPKIATYMKAAPRPFPCRYDPYDINWIGVGRTSKHKPEAMKFMEFWIRPDNQREFNAFGKSIGAVKVKYSEDWLKKHPFMKVYTDPYTIPVNWTIEGLEEYSAPIYKIVVDHVEKVILGDKPAKETMDECQDALERYIEQIKK